MSILNETFFDQEELASICVAETPSTEETRTRKEASARKDANFRNLAPELWEKIFDFQNRGGIKRAIHYTYGKSYSISESLKEQAALIEMGRSISDYNPEKANLDTFLFRVSCNAILQETRQELGFYHDPKTHASRFEEVESNWDDWEGDCGIANCLEDTTVNIEDQVIFNDSLDEFLKQIPKKHSALFQCIIFGYNQTEAAEFCGMHQSQASRIIKMYKTKLAPLLKHEAR